MNKLIAVVGMSGSGKSVVTEYLEENNWTKLYFGGITYKLMNEAGIERAIEGKNEKEFRENLRKEHGPDHCQYAFGCGKSLLSGGETDPAGPSGCR